MADIRIISDRLEPMERAEGWVLLGIVESKGIEWLVLQGEAPFFEIKVREKVDDPNYKLVAGKEPEKEHWRELLAELVESGFLPGPTKRGRELGMKRRQAAIVMSAWNKKPIHPSELFQCVVKTHEGVTTEDCYYCLLKEQCRKRILELGVDPEYTEDIESAKKHVPNLLEDEST